MALGGTKGGVGVRSGWWGHHVRIAPVLLVSAATALVPSGLSAQAQPGSSPARGAVLGAGVGIAAGFGLASATDYALDEGGGFTVALLGGALGAVHGHKLARSWGQPWQTPGRLQVFFPWGHERSDSPADIEQAFAVSGFSGRDGHHSLVPAVTVLYDVRGPVRLGAEISGIRGVHVRATHDLGSINEVIDGRIVSGLLALAAKPSDSNRLSYSVGVGVDRYSVEALSFFDQSLGSPHPSDIAQPDRNAQARGKEWGAHVRAGVEWYLTHEVSFQLNAVRRWNDSVRMPGIRIVDSDGVTVLEHGEHEFGFGSLRMDVGFGLRY